MWLRDLRIVLPDRTLEHGALRLADGQIAAVIAGDPPTDALARSCAGLTALPGIIDLHGDMVEREVEPRVGVAFPVEPALFELDKRLIAAGVTTAYAAISFHETSVRKGVRTVDRGIGIVETINRIQHNLLCDLRVHARFEITHPELIPPLLGLLDAGQIHMLSLTDHTPGQGQYANIERFVEQLAQSRDASRDAIAAQVAARMAWAQEHPIDLAAVAALTQAACARGIPVASHDDDTAAKVALVQELGATICEFPVTLDAAIAARARGMHIVMGAPNALRGESHSGNLHARAAIGEGLVDVLAADYYPAAMLHAAYALARQGLLPLHESVAMISSGPAAALGLHDRGRLAPGARADLVLVEEGQWPRVRATFRNGVAVYTGALPADNRGAARVARD